MKQIMGLKYHSDMEALAEYGYLGLFAASFLAATILPFSSEVVLSFLLLNNYDPFNTVAVATAGNVLGAVVNYAMGFWGSTLILKKLLRISEKDINHAEQRFRKYGTFSLLFAWVPVIGDPLTVAAGVLRVNFMIFLALVAAGKLVRYIIVAFSVLSI